MNTIYVVKDRHWNRLPRALRTIIHGRLQQLYAFTGHRIRVVAPAKLPARVHFTDAILSYSADRDWHGKFKAELARQARQVQRTHGKLFDMSAAIESIVKRRKTKTQAGDSLTSRLVVGNVAANIGLAAVSIPDLVQSVLSSKDFRTFKKDARKLSAKALRKLGRALAGCGAHEVRHVIAGAAHASDGLGKDTPDFLEGFSKPDKKHIRSRRASLIRQQGKRPTVPTSPLRPATGSLLDIRGAGTRIATGTFDLEKILSTLRTGGVGSTSPAGRGATGQLGVINRVTQVTPPSSYGQSRTRTGKVLLASADPRFLPTGTSRKVRLPSAGTGLTSVSTRRTTSGLGPRTSSALGGGESLIARSRKRQQKQAEQRRRSRLEAARGGQGVVGASTTAAIRSKFRPTPTHVPLSRGSVITSVWEGPIGGPSRLIYHVHEPWPGRRHIDLTRHQGR